MHESTAMGFPGKREPEMISLRNVMPTCMLATPKRIPFGKVKTHDSREMTMKPLKFVSNHPDLTSLLCYLPPWQLETASVKRTQ